MYFLVSIQRVVDDKLRLLLLFGSHSQTPPWHRLVLHSETAPGSCRMEVAKCPGGLVVARCILGEPLFSQEFAAYLPSPSVCPPIPAMYHPLSPRAPAYDRRVLPAGVRGSGVRKPWPSRDHAGGDLEWRHVGERRECPYLSRSG